MFKKMIDDIKGSVGLAVEAKTVWEEHVQEGVRIKREIQELESRDGRLSLAGCLKLFLPWANSTAERLSQLRDKVEAPDSVMKESRAAIRRTIHQLIKPAKFTNPVPKNEAAIFGAYGLTASTGELAKEGYTSRELYVLAFIIGAERYPESFGTLNDWETREAKVKSLRDRWDALERLAEKSWSAADLMISLDVTETCRKDGHVKAGFAITGGAIPVGAENFRRTVAHLILHSE